MPRHDRAYGRWEQPSKGGGGQRRKQRTPSNTYAAKQARPSPVAVPVADDGRKDGNRGKGGGKPQAPKPPKGGSKGGQKPPPK